VGGLFSNCALPPIRYARAALAHWLCRIINNRLHWVGCGIDLLHFNRFRHFVNLFTSGALNEVRKVSIIVVMVSAFAMEVHADVSSFPLNAVVFSCIAHF
jgi:hypothetical protein